MRRRPSGVSRALTRVLFAEEGDEGQVCLALELFSKKSQKTPLQTIALAERRLRGWRGRGRGAGI